MRRFSCAFAGALLFWLAISAGGQDAREPKDILTDPFISREEVEDFLRNAEIVKAKGTPIGITNPVRLTLDNGRIRHDAAFKSIDERKLGIYRLEKSTEYDFKDSWKFEVAAYELDKLLNLNMVPPTVERSYLGRKGSLQYWIEGCMSEKDRIDRKLKAPHPVYWNWQVYKVRIFDQLVYNIDRNLGNTLITPDWKCVMIDHSRTFKSVDHLKSPEDMTYFSRSFMAVLEKLDE
ncbi:MAG: hypothetical protein ABIG68_09340, partial [Acidobacteriota bacterium]